MEIVILGFLVFVLGDIMLTELFLTVCMITILVLIVLER